MKPEGNPGPAIPPEAEERELCPNCLTGNIPGINFCKECGAPLSPLAAIGPFERLFAEGHIYRTAAERPHKLIVVLGIWLIFGPTALIGITFPFIADYDDKAFGPGDVLGLLFGLAVVMISVTLIVKSTRNYLARKTSISCREDEITR